MVPLWRGLNRRARIDSGETQRHSGPARIFSLSPVDTPAALQGETAVTVSEPPNPVALQKEPSEEELPTHEDELVVLVVVLVVVVVVVVVLGCKAKRI
ncbi:unnamed protein product [Gadus morhua 'NCC']